LFADGKGTNAIDASAVPHARHEARQMINEVLPVFLHGPVHNVTPPKISSASYQSFLNASISTENGTT
jgi:hypothetical protein